MIPLTWLPLLRKFGPWIAAVLAVLLIYTIGYTRGSAKNKAKYNAKVVEYNQCVDTATHNADEVIKLEEAISLQNDAYAALERTGREHLERVTDAHKRALQRQTTAYQRAVEDARRDTNDLRSQIGILSVAETCHEAWLEVAQ